MLYIRSLQTVARVCNQKFVNEELIEAVRKLVSAEIHD